MPSSAICYLISLLRLQLSIIFSKAIRDKHSSIHALSNSKMAMFQWSQNCNKTSLNFLQHVLKPAFFFYTSSMYIRKAQVSKCVTDTHIHTHSFKSTQIHIFKSTHTLHPLTTQHIQTHTHTHTDMTHSGTQVETFVNNSSRCRHCFGCERVLRWGGGGEGEGEPGTSVPKSIIVTDGHQIDEDWGGGEGWRGNG